MATKVGINGFGRIGRQVLKAIRDKYPTELEVVAVNDIGDLKTMAHLLKYDSTYGRFDGTVEVSGEDLLVDGKHLKMLKETDPANLPWKDLGVDIVIESTGLFTIKSDGVNKKGKTVRGAENHITKGGAKKVIISAPAEGEDLTIVLGVNEESYDPAKHHVVSNASCTTNCLAPAAKVVHDNWTIQRGFMTTIHAYTNDQKILDLPHSDLRRARAAGAVDHPDDDRRREGHRPRHPRPEGEVRRLRAPRPDADRLHRRLHRAAREADDDRRAPPGVPRRRRRPDEGDPRRHRRAARLGRLQGRPALLLRRPAVHDGPRQGEERLREGRHLVRQRVGLQHADGRPGRPHGEEPVGRPDARVATRRRHRTKSKGRPRGLPFRLFRAGGTTCPHRAAYDPRWPRGGGTGALLSMISGNRAGPRLPPVPALRPTLISSSYAESVRNSGSSSLRIIRSKSCAASS